MQHDLIFTKPRTVTLEGFSGEFTASHNTISSGDSNTLLLITGWKYDDVSSRSGLTQVRGQRVE
ncbi:Non-histone chromosomal protein HMG-14 [Nibea albiflora]|uniref:Non-histone chromosomal protein HMG-14 n=1 Tax=Nibea albiflora TaxID=240163 RepID=A0ACB7EQU3_NIBAL|nr:Non-histone chromosomal protein HMG-14 [Nibea albiflora]